MKDTFDNSVAAVSHEREGFFGASADTLEEPTADHAVATVEADFDVVFGEVEGLGGFSGAELFNVAQHDDGAIVLGEVEDCLFQKISELRAGCALFRVRRFRGYLHGWVSVMFDIVERLIAVA